jgi:signal transduction histidine kinase
MASQGQILIVEDDQAVSRLQEKRLTRSGYQVITARTAADARSLLKQGGIDLLILDYRLPDAADGLEFYRELRHSGIEVPAILVTGQADDTTIIRALRTGVRDYVTKSLEYLDYLPEAVQRVLAQEHETRERRRAEQALRAANEQLEKAMAELKATNQRLEQAMNELQSTTQQLWQSAKLASVGELAASIAHELNNPLGIISLRVESVLQVASADHPCRPALEVIEAEVERMAKLVSNLLHFCRPSRDEISTVDLRAEITKTVELVGHHLRRRQIEIEFEFAPDLPYIYADRQKLRQVFLNLFTNAGDAMPGGGKLTIRALPTQVQNGEPGAAIEIIDTGVGIPPELLSKVMDPFFTTKEEGKGTGLGLAICRRIIHDHRGSIEIHSEPGRGTCVRILLPIIDPTNVRELG